LEEIIIKYNVSQMNEVTFDRMYGYWRIACPETQNDVIRLLKGEAKLEKQEVEKSRWQLPELFTMAEVIKITHRSRATINRAIKSGKLRKYQLNGEGGLIQIKREDVFNWIEGSKTNKDGESVKECVKNADEGEERE